MNMKKILITIIFCALGFFSRAQNSSVEKSITGIQIGAVGLWGYYEIKLSNQVSLRTELGIYNEIQAGIGYYIAPELTIEPRWYYNLSKRSTKGKSIINNNGNFFGVKANYRSALFEISNYINNLAETESGFLLIPKWGIRRSFNKNLEFEAGLGFGVEFLKEVNPVAELHLRFGYRF